MVFFFKYGKMKDKDTNCLHSETENALNKWLDQVAPLNTAHSLDNDKWMDFLIAYVENNDNLSWEAIWSGIKERHSDKNQDFLESKEDKLSCKFECGVKFLKHYKDVTKK